MPIATVITQPDSALSILVPMTLLTLVLAFIGGSLIYYAEARGRPRPTPERTTWIHAALLLLAAAAMVAALVEPLAARALGAAVPAAGSQTSVLDLRIDLMAVSGIALITAVTLFAPQDAGQEDSDANGESQQDSDKNTY